MNDNFKFILGALLTIGLSVGGSQCSTNIKMERLDERENNHYLEVVNMLRTMKTDSQDDANAIKSDLQGIRVEILGILKERRR